MTYPYKCRDCGLEFHIILSTKEYEKLRDIVYCPSCKSDNAKRTFFSDGISIQFKDSGFTKYVKEPE